MTTKDKNIIFCNNNSLNECISYRVYKEIYKKYLLINDNYDNDEKNLLTLGNIEKSNISSIKFNIHNFKYIFSYIYDSIIKVIIGTKNNVLTNNQRLVYFIISSFYSNYFLPIIVIVLVFFLTAGHNNISEIRESPLVKGIPSIFKYTYVCFFTIVLIVSLIIIYKNKNKYLSDDNPIKMISIYIGGWIFLLGVSIGIGYLLRKDDELDSNIKFFGVLFCAIVFVFILLILIISSNIKNNQLSNLCNNAGMMFLLNSVNTPFWMLIILFVIVSIIASIITNLFGTGLITNLLMNINLSSIFGFFGILIFIWTYMVFNNNYNKILTGLVGLLLFAGSIGFMGAYYLLGEVTSLCEESDGKATFSDLIGESIWFFVSLIITLYVYTKINLNRTDSIVFILVFIISHVISNYTKIKTSGFLWFIWLWTFFSRPKELLHAFFNNTSSSVRIIPKYVKQTFKKNSDNNSEFMFIILVIILIVSLLRPDLVLST